MLAADFLSFSVADASGDDTVSSVFESSALAVNYDLSVTGGSLTDVKLFAREGGSDRQVGVFNTASADSYVSLDGLLEFDGLQEIFAVASTSDGAIEISDSVLIDVLPTATFDGDFRIDSFSLSSAPGSAAVYRGSGGTDTLSLNVLPADVAGFNGQPIDLYDRDAFTTSQALYDGSAFDYLTLNDGREVYLQGIEILEYSNGEVTELQTRPNDPRYRHQWEITVADVADAWRFTRGSEDVLVASLDTGVPGQNNQPITSDVDLSNTTFYQQNNQSTADGDHGHRAHSTFKSETNNNFGLAGINWDSPSFVTDVYGNTGFNAAIAASFQELDSTPATRIVFAGGIQGEFWFNVLNHSLLSDNLDRSLFSVAAGNGGQDISLTSNSGLSGGVARLEDDFVNILAVGAVRATRMGDGVHTNATSLTRPSYSNFGENLTFAAPTETWSVGPNGSISLFSGTSNANPVMAGYISLVWSANSDLETSEVRQIMADTAMDLGAEGRDTFYGHGMADVGKAVRRAWAIGQDADLANLSANAFGSLDCDFDGDGFCAGADIDALQANIVTGPANPSIYDLTGDGLVTIADRDEWLVRAGSAHLFSGNAYLPGDANLDGVVNGGDFVIWNANKFQSNSNWTAGDFTSDGFVNGGDFVLWNANKFQAADRLTASGTLSELRDDLSDEDTGDSFRWIQSFGFGAEDAAWKRV